MLIKPILICISISLSILSMDLTDAIWIEMKLVICLLGLLISIRLMHTLEQQNWALVHSAFCVIGLVLTNLLWFAGQKVVALGYVVNYFWGTDRIWLFLTITLSLLISHWLTKSC